MHATTAGHARMKHTAVVTGSANPATSAMTEEKQCLKIFLSVSAGANCKHPETVYPKKNATNIVRTALKKTAGKNSGKQEYSRMTLTAVPIARNALYAIMTMEISSAIETSILTETTDIASATKVPMTVTVTGKTVAKPTGPAVKANVTGSANNAILAGKKWKAMDAAKTLRTVSMNASEIRLRNVLAVLRTAASRVKTKGVTAKAAAVTSASNARNAGIRICRHICAMVSSNLNHATRRNIYAMESGRRNRAQVIFATGPILLFHAKN